MGQMQTTFKQLAACSFLTIVVFFSLNIFAGNYINDEVHVKKQKRFSIKPVSIKPVIGVASYYNTNFNGKRTASGEKFSNNAMTGAHKTLPFNTQVKVINMRNKKWVVVRINDRGPFVKGRIIDLSKAAASKIGLSHHGTARVKLEVLRS